MSPNRIKGRACVFDIQSCERKKQQIARNSLQLIIIFPHMVRYSIDHFFSLFFIRIESGTCVFDIQSVNGKNSKWCKIVYN